MAVPNPITVTFNIVDDYMRPVLIYGAPATLQYNDVTSKYAMNAKELWADFIRTMAAKGDLGEKVIDRSPAQRGDPDSTGLIPW